MVIGGVGDDTIVAVIDPLTEENERGHRMGYLRSLPYLIEHGVRRYTFPPQWLRHDHTGTFDEVMEETDAGFQYTALSEFQFDYHIIEPDAAYNEIAFDQLCQYTTEGIEEPGKPSITHKILQAYNDDLIDDFVLVTNSSSFAIADHVTQKPLFEKFDKVTEFSYESLAKDYIQSVIGGPYISVGTTLNIWLHQAAADLVESTGSRPTRIAELFAFDEIPSTVRTWDVLEFLASEYTEEEADHIGATIRPWIESDISRTRTNIHNALQRFGYDAKKVREYRFDE